MAGIPFGFKAEQRGDEESSELEEKLGARFVPKKNEPYPNHIDNWCEFRSAAGETAQGVYRGRNDKDLYVFSPFINVCPTKIDRKGNPVKQKWFISNGIKTLNALHSIIYSKDLDEKAVRGHVSDFNLKDYTK